MEPPTCESSGGMGTLKRVLGDAMVRVDFGGVEGEMRCV